MKRAKLHFVFGQDCEACREMQPILLKWQTSRKFDPPVIRSLRDVTSRQGETFSPKLTPGLAVEVDGRFVATHEGKMTAVQLDRWFDEAMS
jgi:hypothetical protein